MKEFPSTSALSFLSNLELEGIYLARFFIQFSFEKDVFIVVEYAFEHRTKSGETYQYNMQSGIEAMRLHSLIGARIDKITSDSTKLSLMFSNAEVLLIKSALGPLESGHIGNGAERIIF